MSSTDTPATKRTLSPAEIEACRRNGSRSKGPVTPEGKAASSRNALKHGLSGSGAHLNAEDAAELQSRLADWERHLRPRDPAELWHARQAALATVRIDRLQREDEEALAVRRRGATRAWDEKRAAEVAALADRLMETPGEAVAGLLRTAEG